MRRTRYVMGERDMGPAYQMVAQESMLLSVNRAIVSSMSLVCEAKTAFFMEPGSIAPKIEATNPKR